AWLVAEFPMPAEFEKAVTTSSTLAACDSCAVISALVMGVLAWAAQTSAVPGWVLLRATSDQLKPAPLTVAVWPLPVPGLSPDTKATIRSDPPVVDRLAVAVPVELNFVTFWSIAGGTGPDWVVNVPSPDWVGPLRLLLSTRKWYVVDGVSPDKVTV